MFQAPLCPSSGARECYTDGCCLWYLVLWFSSCRYGVELRVVCPVCGLRPANRTSWHFFSPYLLSLRSVSAPKSWYPPPPPPKKNVQFHNADQRNIQIIPSFRSRNKINIFLEVRFEWQCPWRFCLLKYDTYTYTHTYMCIYQLTRRRVWESKYSNKFSNLCCQSQDNYKYVPWNFVFE
jgi:hypothetical protein